MTDNLNLPDDRKLSITYRVESGCLGPDGINIIDNFCSAAQEEFESLDAGFVKWYIVPRNDKSLPEIQFNVLGKMLTEAQAEKYLTAFKKNLGDVEEHLSDKIATLIDGFMGH